MGGVVFQLLGHGVSTPRAVTAEQVEGIVAHSYHVLYGEGNSQKQPARLNCALESLSGEFNHRKTCAGAHALEENMETKLLTALGLAGLENSPPAREN